MRIPRSGGGFTLVEILVVVLIVGLVSAGLLLSVGLAGRDRDLEQESERLVALVRYAREQAELQTREIGVLYEPQGYRFLAYDPRRDLWRTIEGDETLRERRLPEGLRLRLAIEGRDVVLRPPDRDRNRTKVKSEDPNLVPHVLLYSNGDLTPFELTLERDGGERRVIIASDERGNIELGELQERG